MNAREKGLLVNQRLRGTVAHPIIAIGEGGASTTRSFHDNASPDARADNASATVGVSTLNEPSVASDP